MNGLQKVSSTIEHFLLNTGRMYLAEGLWFGFCLLFNRLGISLRMYLAVAVGLVSAGLIVWVLSL